MPLIPCPRQNRAPGGRGSPSIRFTPFGIRHADDRPRVLPVTFAVAGDAVWSAIDHKRKRVEGRELARVRWLSRNPAAALTVDRYDDDWARLAWVQALGDVELTFAKEYPKFLNYTSPERYA